MQNTKQNNKGSVVLGALLRLALLLGPEGVVLKVLGHSPVVCFFAGLLVLALWLSVDVGPFRAASAKAATRPVPVENAGFAQNLTKAQWWSFLFCRVIVFFMLFHSKLTP